MTQSKFKPGDVVRVLVMDKATDPDIGTVGIVVWVGEAMNHYMQKITPLNKVSFWLYPDKGLVGYRDYCLERVETDHG